MNPFGSLAQTPGAHRIHRLEDADLIEMTTDSPLEGSLEDDASQSVHADAQTMRRSCFLARVEAKPVAGLEPDWRFDGQGGTEMRSFCTSTTSRHGHIQQTSDGIR